MRKFTIYVVDDETKRTWEFSSAVVDNDATGFIKRMLTERMPPELSAEVKKFCKMVAEAL